VGNSAVLLCRVARLINKEDDAVKKYCQEVMKYKEQLIEKIDKVLKQITPKNLSGVHFVKIDDNCFMTPCPIPPDPDDGIDD
jgi:GTP-binding protein EngB required for normal cell division